MPLPNGKNVSNLFPGGSKGHSSNGLSEKTITSSSDLYSTILGGLFFQMVGCILAVFTKVFLSPNPLFSKILQLTRNKGKSFFDRNIPHQNENHLLEIQISEVPERSNPQPKTYHLLVVPTTTSPRQRYGDNTTIRDAPRENWANVIPQNLRMSTVKIGRKG